MRPKTLGALLVMSISAAGCLYHTGEPLRNSHTDLDDRIHDAVPVGATRQEIEAWLDARGIEHSFSDEPRHRFTGSQSIPIEDFSGCIRAVVRYSGHARTVWFILDKQGRKVDLNSFEVIPSDPRDTDCPDEPGPQPDGPWDVTTPLGSRFDARKPGSVSEKQGEDRP